MFCIWRSCYQNVILVTYMWFPRKKVVYDALIYARADLTPKLRQLNLYWPQRALIVRNFLESLHSGSYRNADLKSSFVNFFLPWLSFMYSSSIFGMWYKSRLVHLFTVILLSPHRWIDLSVLRTATIGAAHSKYCMGSIIPKDSSLSSALSTFFRNA